MEDISREEMCIRDSLSALRPSGAYLFSSGEHQTESKAEFNASLPKNIAGGVPPAIAFYLYYFAETVSVFSSSFLLAAYIGQNITKHTRAKTEGTAPAMITVR